MSNVSGMVSLMREYLICVGVAIGGVLLMWGIFAILKGFGLYE